ncbi:uncharacterized protein NECHADRAFT_88464 [Fusarium vanettenii 77-13-4]|uniref:Uncharacterized protein n=1 Tax=Fusarium vanettenii (strain ATCC MYA-4622 / CBS 123669 / FGSC 9596 / NRRL 45880 / 77-13-4) TaxID=660122 RepID=C7ZBL1_FUSV7|nr:uncharacterized protein NECHADRAFT_88464 [Fusarium vanettenii 77-13-4]EEU38590.1 predicted protein [Fusarium vanettenii 77-13-4]
MMSESCALFTYRAHALTHADAGQPGICEHKQPPPKVPGAVKTEGREHGRTIDTVTQKKSSRWDQNARARATKRTLPCSTHPPALPTSPYPDGARKNGESRRARRGRKARELAMFNARPPK